MSKVERQLKELMIKRIIKILHTGIQNLIFL